MQLTARRQAGREDTLARRAPCKFFVFSRMFCTSVGLDPEDVRQIRRIDNSLGNLEPPGFKALVYQQPIYVASCCRETWLWCLSFRSMHFILYSVSPPPPRKKKRGYPLRLPRQDWTENPGLEVTLQPFCYPMGDSTSGHVFRPVPPHFPPFLRY